MKTWLVYGRTESGDEWNLEFIGLEPPTEERINFVFAELFPDEWDYMPEAGCKIEASCKIEEAYPVIGPTLETGEERQKGKNI